MYPMTHTPLRGALAALLVTALAACGGGGGDNNDIHATGSGSARSSASNSNAGSSSAAASSGGSAASSLGAASSSSSAAASATSRASSSSSASRTGVYATAPVVASCTPGVVSDGEKTAVLARINEIRARHGLPAVSYDSTADQDSAAAALYMVANSTLTHTPSSSGACYTQAAYNLASTSNLYYASGGSTLSMASTDAITAYLVDSGVSSLGHRRWILYPFFGSTSFGRADADSGAARMASSLRTIGGEASSVSMSNDFVAYPYGNYPAKDFSTSWYLSFSVVASKTNRYANGSAQVSFANATISVAAPDGSQLAITDRSEDYSGYGLANSLQWKASGLNTGTTYTVTIANATVNGASRNFSYNFTLQ